jgi:hypothetical protein
MSRGARERGGTGPLQGQCTRCPYIAVDAVAVAVGGVLNGGSGNLKGGGGGIRKGKGRGRKEMGRERAEQVAVVGRREV